MTASPAAADPARRMIGPAGGSESDPDISSFVFVGTGVSTAIPLIGHIGTDCACKDAIENPQGPNRRNNVSLLVRHKGTNVLIDAGKTYRDAYFRTLMPRRVSSLHAVLITHDHADAIFGIDDLRDTQRFRTENLNFICETPLPMYLSEHTLATVSRVFDYIINNSRTIGPAHVPVDEPVVEVMVQRRVACLRLRIVDDTAVQPVHFEPGILEGLPFFSVPVFHGGAYRCLGFAFGHACKIATGNRDEASSTADFTGGVARNVFENAPGSGRCIVYLSDISGVPENVMAALDTMSAIDVLVVDMLQDEDHFAHYGIHKAFELIVRLQPRVAYGTGMYCKLEHHATSKLLADKFAAYKEEVAQAGGTTRIESVLLAYDGLELPLSTA